MYELQTMRNWILMPAIYISQMWEFSSRKAKRIQLWSCIVIAISLSYSSRWTWLKKKLSQQKSKDRWWSCRLTTGFPTWTCDLNWNTHTQSIISFILKRKQNSQHKRRQSSLMHASIRFWWMNSTQLREKTLSSWYDCTIYMENVRSQIRVVTCQMTCET